LAASNTDRYQTALALLRAYISDIKFRKINIDYMQSQLQPNPETLFYNDVEICPSNSNIIWQLVKTQTNEEVGQLTFSKEILREFLVGNNAIRMIEGGGIESWHKERIAYCEFHKRTLSFMGVVHRQCLHRNGKQTCKWLVAINYPFWESKYAEKLKKIYIKYNSDKSELAAI
jgi:hypothetical protein